MDYEKKYKDALVRAKAMIKIAINKDEAIGFTIIFYRYEDGRLVENDGWHRYSRKLVEDRINRQNSRVTYQALIREEWWQPCKVWHELDLTKSKKYKQRNPIQLTLF